MTSHMDAQGRITEIRDLPATPQSQVEVDRLQGELTRELEYWKKKNAADPPPTGSAIGDASTPRAIADASRKVAHLLLTNQVDPNKGRTTLYALQVCLSALRVTENNSRRDGRVHPSKRSFAPPKKKLAPKKTRGRKS